jgi:hypothetical protein
VHGVKIALPTWIKSVSAFSAKDLVRISWTPRRGGTVGIDGGQGDDDKDGSGTGDGGESG